MTAHSQPLLHYLRRLTAPARNDASDAVLLERFVSRRDEAAFAALLARHGPMVHGICRRILRDDPDAEDVFQTTFLVLARKAGSLRRPETLAAWLHGTARRLALTSRRAAARRRQREVRCLETVPPPSQGDLLDELSVRELLLVLDEEMGHLPETYRLPLLLCCLEGHSHEEAARILGWTAGSLKGRLEEEVGRLPEKFRTPVVLCYLQSVVGLPYVVRSRSAERTAGIPTGQHFGQMWASQKWPTARL